MAQEKFEKKTLRIFDIIDSFQKLNGYPPSFREIRNMTGYSLATIHLHIDLLVENKYLEKRKYVARGITVLAPYNGETLRSKNINERDARDEERRILHKLQRIGRMVPFVKKTLWN